MNRSEITLLLADDTFEILSMVKKRFESRGYNIVEANNGEEALEQALTEHPHLMVLDVMMPKMNGWEVCKYIRSKESLNDVGIIMLTAIGPTLNELTSPLYGADAHLDKPFDLDELEALVEKVLLDRHEITVS
ncbi:MAG TPA: response regulator [Myxococcales bacterium]|nr:response regulator [Myxococcales bacterium]HIN86722.1 response regulator [Myxococcales bacterium]